MGAKNRLDLRVFSCIYQGVLSHYYSLYSRYRRMSCTYASQAACSDDFQVKHFAISHTNSISLFLFLLKGHVCERASFFSAISISLTLFSFSKGLENNSSLFLFSLFFNGMTNVLIRFSTARITDCLPAGLPSCLAVCTQPAMTGYNFILPPSSWS